jgi:hypothetical protein
VLNVARLQDYSYRMSRLVALNPAQFCKSGDLFSMRVNIGHLHGAANLSHPRCIDVTSDDLGAGASEALTTSCSDTSESDSGSLSVDAPFLPPRHVKRLGFGGLMLEPEYLLDRLRHECSELSLPVLVSEVRVHGSEVLRMEVSRAPAASAAAQGASGTAIVPAAAVAGPHSPPSLDPDPAGFRTLVHVMPEDGNGTYSISLMRLAGDTFDFHSLYRSLRDRLKDITVPQQPSSFLAPTQLPSRDE